MAGAIGIEAAEVVTAIEEAVEEVTAIGTEFGSVAARSVCSTNDTTECPGTLATTLPPSTAVESTEGNETELSITFGQIINS